MSNFLAVLQLYEAYRFHELNVNVCSLSDSMYDKYNLRRKRTPSHGPDNFLPNTLNL